MCRELLVAIAGLVAMLSTATAQDAVKPAPEHAWLQDQAGQWEVTMKGMDGADEKGTVTAKPVCGGLWIASDFRISFGPAKFEGHGLDGYDLDKKKFVSVWVDSMSTAPMLFEGRYDKEAKKLTMTAEGKGPDGKPARFKSVTTIPDKDHHTFDMYLVGPDGKDQLMMTIHYARKK